MCKVKPKVATGWSKEDLQRNISVEQNMSGDMKEAERSFVCPACDHRFKLKHHLQNHRKVCKRINVNNEVRVFKCKDCDKAFKLKHHLTVHEKNVHNDRKEYKCKTCDKMVPFND